MGDLDEQRERARAAREALLGTAIAGKWVLRSLIGHGGMGAVYEAENTGLGKRVAIKFVDPEFATDEQVVARFAREARAMSAIESGHIVTVLDAGTEGGRPYLVMELLRGEDLGQRLRRTRTIPVAEALHIIAQVLKGLARAHAAGIVHRDLKPDNVFLSEADHDPLFVKIVDFGVSKIDRPRASTMPMALTGRGTVLGTPLYMSPEQAQSSSNVDARADLYSVGAILFECVTGRPPHVGESYEQVILSICMSDAPDVRTIEPNVPEDVAKLVAKALARDPDKRFSSADAMLAAVRAVAPVEKARAAPEPKLAGTLVSAGNERFEHRREQTGRAHVQVEQVRERERHAPDRRGLRLYVMAGVATLAGVGATFGVISAFDRGHDDVPPPIPTSATLARQVDSTPTAGPAPPVASSALAPEPSSSPARAGASSPAGAASSPPEPGTSLARVAPGPTRTVQTTTPRPSAKPATGKPLDIQRDLPP